MYDPETSDSYNEWVELYNPTNESINISGWSIIDNSGEDEIEGDFDHGNGTMIIPSYFYAIITDHGTKAYENFSIANTSISLYVDDKSIGNGLGNSGDKLVLKNNHNETIDAVEWITNFSEIQGDPAKAVEENLSLSRYKNSNNSYEAFYEGFPTPGAKNKILEKGETKIILEDADFLISRNEILDFVLTIKNLGDFKDYVTTKLVNVTEGWVAHVNYEKIFLNPNESKDVILSVTPCENYGCNNGNLTIIAASEKEINKSDEKTLFFEILAPDLWVKQIKTYNEDKNETDVIKQGEMLWIKAFLKNLGKENATNIEVCCYYDEIKPENLISCKYYESIGKYQKYPSFYWDTTNIEYGFHTIFVIVDEKDTVEELDEENNELTYIVEIIDTSPCFDSKKIVISEIYYHSHPGLKNEFIKIYNPSDVNLDISYFYLTNNPWKTRADQRKIEFPKNTRIPPKNYIVISENASSYLFEVGNFPDFEYNVDSSEIILQMNATSKFILSNSGGILALKNDFNHTIDVVAYGEIDYSISGWNGSYIKSSGEGVVLKRTFDEKNNPVDTDTSYDWINNRFFSIGQSSFPYLNFSFYGKITCFVSPDNSYNVITSKLRSANESVYLNMYEFTSPYLCDELIKVLLRNVSVYIFLEGAPVGGVTLEEKYILHRIINYGGSVRFIVNSPENKIFARYRFNHAKYLIIDNKTVIVESCNWADSGVPKSNSFGNREWGVVIENKSVAKYFLGVFLDDWNPVRRDSWSFDMLNLSIPSGFYMYNNVYRGFYRPYFESCNFVGRFTTIPVFSPDTSYKAVYNMIKNANKSIYIEQLYIYKDWSDKINPFLDLLANKSKNGIDVKIILNYNPFYSDTNEKCNYTKKYLENNSIKVRFHYTNWSYFSNVHNKGVIIDNKTVLISSINWNENSFMNNREAGVIIENESVARYFAQVFFYDWDLKKPVKNESRESFEIAESSYENTIYIVIIYTMTFLLIFRDWRKRKWH